MTEYARLQPLEKMMAEAYFVAKDISADRLTSEYSMAKKMLPEEIPDGLALVRIMKKAANKRKLIEECDKSATSSSSSVRQACFDNISYIIKQLCACDVKRLDELYTDSPPFQMMWIRGLEEKALERTQGNVEHLRSFKPERCLFSSRLYGHIHSKVRSDTLPPVGLSASAQPNNFRRMRYTRRGRLYRRPEPGISGENLQYRELDRLINRNNVDEDDSGAVAEDDVSKDDGEIRAKQENDPSSDVASWLKTSKPSKDFYEDYEKKEYDEDFLVRYLEEASFETIFPLENKIEESFGLYEYSTECLANFARAGGIYFSEEQHFPFKGEGIAFRVLITRLGRTSRSHGVIIKFLEEQVSPELLSLLNVRVDCRAFPMTLKPLPFLGKRTDFNFMIPKEIMRGNLGYFQIIVTINAKPDQKELTFRCKGGAVIKGPKALIMEKCEYLQVASKYDPAGVVLCPEFSVESVSLWILYLFHGTSFFSPSIDLAVEVSYFADRCNTPELQNEVACKVIGRNLTRLDLNDVLNFAFNLRMFGLAEKVATYIIENKSVLAEVSVTYEDEFLEFWFAAFHNVFLRYLKGEYIPSRMEEKAKGLAKIWKQKTFISELERTLSFFVNH